MHFAVWAPNAQRVSVVGDFNAWDGRRHTMRKRVGTGVWEIFVPALGEGTLYKYEIVGADRHAASAQGRSRRLRRGAATRRPRRWCATRRVSLGPTPTGWRRGPRAIRAARRCRSTRCISARGGAATATAGSPTTSSPTRSSRTRRTWASRISSFMPVNEHPLDDSWGYQPIGLFAPTSRFGEPAAFARFVDRCHRAGLGVIIDWVPAHFPVDPHGLAAVRRHGALRARRSAPGLPSRLEHGDLQFRPPRGRELPHRQRALLARPLSRRRAARRRASRRCSISTTRARQANGCPTRTAATKTSRRSPFCADSTRPCTRRHPGAITIAEESTAWPAVSQPTFAGGLGFGFKWNMGWMHDTLEYLGRGSGAPALAP